MYAIQGVDRGVTGDSRDEDEFLHSWKMINEKKKRRRKMLLIYCPLWMRKRERDFVFLFL